MLIPVGISPEDSLYFIGAKIIEHVAKSQGRSIALSELIESMHRKEGLSAAMTILSLDWLYLADAAYVNEAGNVILCS